MLLLILIAIETVLAEYTKVIVRMNSPYSLYLNRQIRLRTYCCLQVIDTKIEFYSIFQQIFKRFDQD